MLALTLGLRLVMVTKLQPLTEELELEPTREEWKLLALMSIGMAERRFGPRATRQGMEMFLEPLLCGRLGEGGRIW